MEVARASMRRGDDKAALSMLRQHEARFASGILADERRQSMLRAFCGLGRVDEARRYLDELEREHPNDRWQPMFDASCPPP